MAENGGKKPKKSKKGRIFLTVFLLVFTGVPLVCIALSFIGRLNPEAVIPNSFEVYCHIPNPARFSQRLLAHEALPSILADPALAPLIPVISQIRESRILENRWFQFFVRGTLDGAVLDGKRQLAAWDTGILAPFLRLLPMLAGRFTIPDLYYVQAGKNSRFEYRLDNGTVYYIAPYHNLLVAANDSDLFESVMNGTSRDGDIRGASYKTINTRNFDIAFLVSQDMILNMLSGQDPKIRSVLDQLNFPGLIEAAVSVYPAKLEINLFSSLSSSNESLKQIIEHNSELAVFTQLLPDTTQYSTVVSAAAFEELMNAAVSIFGPGLSAALKRADSSSRMLFRLSIEDLLYSWTGREFAVFGMEGRPSPVYAVQIGDEQARQQVFDRAFKSIFLNENTQFVLDGNRIPQIRLPDFVEGVLHIMGVNLPSPYYVVQNDFLFVSESAENLLAAVNGIRKNAILPRTAAWKTLAQSGSDKASFSLFYSLDRSLPFFLRGNTPFNAILRLYRQGLARLSFENRAVIISLAALSGSGSGAALSPGYPLDLGGKGGSAVYALATSRRGEGRFFLTRDNAALSINPADQSIYELKNPRPVQIIPAAGPGFSKITDPAAWVVNSQGQVTLVNGNMEPVNGFPFITGVRLSAPPAAHGGNLYLSDDSGDEGHIYVVDPSASVSQWDLVFDTALRSAPVFLDVSDKTYAGIYPKSFISHEIWLTDAGGNPYPGWPVSVSGIAFGSPLLFAQGAGRDSRVLAAFITTAGELTVVDESGTALSAFPLELNGVFYQQPVYDGEFLWIIESGGSLYQISLEGTVLHQKIPNLTVKESGYIAAFDVDGDKVPEIFFTGEGNALYGYARNFNSLDGFPLPVWGRPAFGDFNGDGKMECAGIGLDNKLYRWQFK
ncbi:MAG: hypothetical protein LBO80_05390 [Treponema sp.]|jgi:hypothetical protein|nr:hypothetical protein [Treponema sp.]